MRIKMKEEKLCKNCRWHKPENNECKYVLGKFISKTDGLEHNKYQRWMYCESLRQEEFLGWLFSRINNTCGPQGRFFERK